MYKLLNATLNAITKRFSFILINLLTFIFSIYCLKYLFGFVQVYDSKMNPEIIDQMSDTLNSVAGLLVALGVLMECRITIQKMTKFHIPLLDDDRIELEEYLNEIAEHNGMGLLLIGLFMEIATLIIYVPNTLIDTSGIEIYLFYSCFLFIIISMLVELDLIKDYTISYFKHPKHNEKK